MCYHFDDVISLNKKLYENISVYNISSKTPTGPRTLDVWYNRFDKIGEFIISVDGKIRHLVLHSYGLFDTICCLIQFDTS